MSATEDRSFSPVSNAAVMSRQFITDSVEITSVSFNSFIES